MAYPEDQQGKYTEEQVGQRYSDRYDVNLGMPVAQAPAQVRAGFLQKVYMTLFVGVAIAMGVAFLAMNHTIETLKMGQSDMLTKLFTGRTGMWMIFIAYVVLAMAAGASARVKGLNVLLYTAFTAVTGLLLTPLFIMAFVSAGQSYSIIWNAFGVTALVFGGLTGYVFISGKDFSFMGGFLTVGIFVLLGFMVGTFFFQAPAFQMAVTVGGLLLFALFVLYDTSQIMLRLDPSEWVAGALSLFIDFINMFIRILSLMSNRR